MIAKWIDKNKLTDKSRAVLEKTGISRVTRNSRCPCGSGSRFKRCCMELRDPFERDDDDGHDPFEGGDE